MLCRKRCRKYDMNTALQSIGTAVEEPLKLQVEGQMVLRQRERQRIIQGISTLLFEKLAFEGFGLEESLRKEIAMKLIKPRSKKFWYIDFIANGKRNRWSTKCEKKGEAELVRNKLLREIAVAENTAVERRIKQEHTLEEAINKYLSEHSQGIKLSYKRDLNSSGNLLRDIGNLRLSEITPETIYSWQQKRRNSFFKNGKQLSPRTVNIERSLLYRIFELAKNQWCWTERNPVTSVSPLSYDGARTKWFTEKERDNLLSLCESFGYYWFKDLLEFLWLTGFRIGEVLPLTCGQVFLEAELPYVELRREKSGIVMKYPLTIEKAKSILKKHCSGKTNDEHVFTLDGKPVKYQQARTCWEKVREAAGLEDCHMHDCRHTFATECYKSELDDMTIKNLLGQKTIQVTRGYIHPQFETLAERLKRVEKKETFGTLLAPLPESKVPA